MTCPKRWCAGLLALAMCFLAGLTTADAQSRETLSISYVEIAYDGFVADSMDGVDAVYNLTTASPDCAELVERYYKTLYGIDVVLGSQPYVSGTDKYWFEQTAIPGHGDILFSPASVRGYNHYALCREADLANNTMTLFEQNWLWGTKAGVNRQVAIGLYYTAYTLRSASGAVTPLDPSQTVPQSPPQAQEPQSPVVPPLAPEPAPFGPSGPSQWAQDYVRRAEIMGIVQRQDGGYQQPITRGEYARLVVDAAKTITGCQTSGGTVIQEAKELDLMGGDANGDFRQLDGLSREEGAVVMYRLINLIGSLPAVDQSALNIYPDKAAIAWWSADAASIMTQTGLMGGTGKGFDPRSQLTVEQAIALLMRTYDKFSPV